MNYEARIEELPEYTVYYKEGVINSFDELVPFILSSAEECRAINPNIECLEPDYCYVSYLDNEYKESDIHIRYAQAVKEIGTENDTIKFEKLDKTKAICVAHKGAYSGLRAAYDFALNYANENGYEITASPRERYIDGMWNKEDEAEWLTEIQIPIK